MTTLILFIASFIVIASTIGHKMFEMSGKSMGLGGLRAKIDALLHGRVALLKQHSKIIEKGSFKVLCKVFLASVLGAFAHGAEKIQEKWADFFHSLNTSAVLKNSGQVSFFLKDISRFKEKPEVNF